MRKYIHKFSLNETVAIICLATCGFNAKFIGGIVRHRTRSVFGKLSGLAGIRKNYNNDVDYLNRVYETYGEKGFTTKEEFDADIDARVNQLVAERSVG